LIVSVRTCSSADRTRSPGSGELRPFQKLALDAFDADRAAGRRSTHLVAPPGSGKTVIGSRSSAP
jgi:superfamily II DNA or RNA helicase